MGSVTAWVLAMQVVFVPWLGLEFGREYGVRYRIWGSVQNMGFGREYGVR